MTEPTAHWTDADGNTVDGPAGAAAVEIQTYDEQGVPAERTYATVNGQPRIRLATSSEEQDVADPVNADWIKSGTWDLYDPVTLAPVTTLAQLLAVVGAEGGDVSAQRRAVAGLIELPSWDAAPETLKADVYGFLERTRPAR